MRERQVDQICCLSASRQTEAGALWHKKHGRGLSGKSLKKAQSVTREKRQQSTWDRNKAWTEWVRVLEEQSAWMRKDNICDMPDKRAKTVSLSLSPEPLNRTLFHCLSLFSHDIPAADRLAAVDRGIPQKAKQLICRYNSRSASQAGVPLPTLALVCMKSGRHREDASVSSVHKQAAPMIVWTLSRGFCCNPLLPLSRDEIMQIEQRLRSLSSLLITKARHGC